MANLAALKKKVQELAEKNWDIEPTEAWFKKLYEEGIPNKTLLHEEVIAGKEEVLYRVQRKAEDCEYLCHS
jgi:hypothetical protein